MYRETTRARVVTLENENEKNHQQAKNKTGVLKKEVARLEKELQAAKLKIHQVAAEREAIYRRVSNNW